MLSPLNQGEIRLLSIPPAQPSSDTTPQIEYDLIVASISHAVNFPKYETLSYVWGSGVDSVTITISGQPKVVSQSVNNALRRLQLPDRKRLVWIDQICINQQDLVEKAKQVQLMSVIYSKCSGCIAWMGEIRDDVSLADAVAATELLQYMATASPMDDPNRALPPPTFPNHFEAATKALKTISWTENQWWGRIWTVQEAALPDHVTLQWGPLEINWKVLTQARLSFVRKGPQLLHDTLRRYPAGRSVIQNLVSHITWLNLAKLRHDDLFVMIHRYRYRSATNPRDKIYGLLGLHDKSRLPMSRKCDYGVPVAQVFTVLTQELIIEQNGLRPLTNTPRQQPSESTPNIPSWALDLNRSIVAYSPDVYYLIHGYSSYRAAEGLGQIDLEAIRSTLGQNTLDLMGVYVDTVARVEDGFKTKMVANLSNIPATEALLPNWYTIGVGCAFNPGHSSAETVSTKLYPTGECTRADAFARFVLGDVIRNQDQVPIQRAQDKDIQHVWKIMSSQASDVPHNTRRTVYGMMVNQHMFVTKTGLLGCGHMDTEVGDEVWVFRGGNVPFTIRSRKDKPGYKFIGQCYVQGIMRGETASRGGYEDKIVSLH